MIITHPVTRTALLGLLFIVGVAFWLRAADGAAITHFKYDQAEMARMAMEIWHGDAFHWLGTPNSAGIPNSPLTIWIYVPVLALSHSPQVLTLFVALWNVLGVALLWWIGHRYFGPAVGFLAGVLIAVSPWAVYYSRAIWEPRTIIPLLLLALAAGLYGYVERKTWVQVAFVPLLLIALQFHYVALTLLPLYLCILWAGRANINWRATALSVVLGVLTLLPFAIGLMQGDSESTGSTAGRINQIVDIWRAGPELRTYPISLLADLTTGFGMSADMLQDQTADFLTLHGRLEALWWAVGAFTLLGLAFVWLMRRWRPYAPLLLLWSLLTLLVLTPAWTGSGVYHHHFAANLPALMLLAAIGLAGSLHLATGRLKHRGMLWGFGLGIPTILLLIGQGWHVQQVYAYWDAHHTLSSESGQTATPLHYLLDVREALQAYDDVILLGANPHESNFYIWQPMLYETASCVRDLIVNDGRIDVLPDGSFAAVVAPLQPINAGYNVPERYTHDDPIIVPLRPDEDPYRIYPFAVAPPWTQTPITDIAPVPYTAGVALTGYHLAENTLQLRWRVLDAPGEDYSYFVHFMNEHGERIGQRDGPFYAGHYWCSGDTLIITTHIADHPEATHMRVGLYTRDADGGTTNQQTLDSAGNASGQWATIGIP